MEAIECSAMARASPHFVKVYFPDLSSDHLIIPPAFRGYIEHESPGTVSLKGPGGRTWTVELVKSQKGLLFESGWKEFVADHSIVPGDFLVFRYEGRLQFSVLVFDATACEKETAFLARPYREYITIVDGSEGDEDGKALEEHIAIVDGSEGDEEGKALLEEHIAIVDGTKGDEEGKALLEEHDSKALVLSPSGSSGVGRKRTMRSTGCLEIEDPPLKKKKKKRNKGVASISEVVLDSSKSKEETPGRISPLSGALTTLQRYNTVKKQQDKLNNARTKQAAKTSPCSATAAESLHKKLVRLSKKRVSKQSSQDSERLELLERNYVPRSGEVGAKKRQMPALRSQRRPATEEDVNKMLKLANSFKSKNPFVHVVMQESYVYSGFFLNIPSHFVKEYLPKVNKKMTLWDPNGKPWEVNFVNYGNRGGFSAGWAKFSYANNLEKYDICVFELIKRSHMKVHIFRVVKKIAPLLRNTKRKN